MTAVAALEAAYQELHFRFQRGDDLPPERILELLKRRIEMEA